MAVIHIREQRTVIRKRGGRIVLEKDKEMLRELPLIKVDSVAVYGNVQVTTQALSELLERGIPLTLYTINGRLKGRLVPETSRNVELRLKQYEWSVSEERSLAIAREIVAAKLWNSAEVVEDWLKHQWTRECRDAEARLREGAAQALQAENLDTLRGVEGAGAAAYFAALASANRSGLPFPGRVQHPATDPINALLSLGYTLLMAELRALAEGAGLEPHLGFLHRADYGRPSLALDLMEPFRAPVVDRLTLRLVNQRVFEEQDFARRLAGPQQGGVILLPGSFRHYLAQWEKALIEPRRGAPDGMRGVLQAQVDGLCRLLRGDAEWKPYREGTNAVADIV